MWGPFVLKDLESLHQTPKAHQFLIVLISFFIFLSFIFKSIIGGVFASSTVLMIFLFCPQVFAKINRYWFIFGLFVGWLVSPVFLTLFYFLFFTPMALFLKFLGHKPYLRQGWVRKSKTCDFTRLF